MKRRLTQMIKISKSDLPIDYRPASEQVAAMWSGPKCEHFAVGTRIKVAHQPPATILSIEDGVLTCQYDDGRMTTVRPIALN